MTDTKTFSEYLEETMVNLSDIERAYAIVIGSLSTKRYVARHAKNAVAEQRYLDLIDAIYTDVNEEYGLFSVIHSAAREYRNVKLESLGYVWSSDSEEYELVA